jgi:predicted Zn-dependent peptidase
MRHQVHRFENGVTLATASMPHMASVSVGLWVGVGGRFEAIERHGASHFIEHMLFKGTKRRTAHEISQAVEGVGGYLNAFTGEENTCFYAKARAEHFEHLLDVLMEMFLESKFDTAEIEKEREVIKEELAMYQDQPHHLVHEILNETMWPNHPLGRPLTGSIESLDHLGRKELIAFRAEKYVAPAMVIAVAGNIDHAAAVKTVRRAVRRMPAAKRPGFVRVDSDQMQPRIRFVAKQTSQLQLAIGIRVCCRHDERRFALRLLDTLLGENASSRLFQVLREDHGLTYCIHSNLSHFDDAGCLTISAGLDSSDLSKTMKLLVAELRRFIDRAPTVKELREARDYLIGQMEIGLESTENQMMWLGEHLLGYGKVISASEIKSRLREVGPTHVRQMAREFFQPDRISLAVVSPLESAPGIEKQLRRIGS